ncbi:hypothetical protein GCM10007242_41670 [Pigmentiphaga litoralis]|uniref:hypothetical protein n=1 Tax=Pigmentiphaga litoralis TaxID=516702 RepID=UPI0016795ACA|nr:hypothetical protein [Pigmentiphaga litoralis]GGX30633.1 hypothetical protein GCM10007242_41670 [Pigmentiphaga litoralis]
MSPLSTLGIGAVAGLLVGAAAGWTVQGWRGTAAMQTQVAVVASERADAATAARTAEADQRQIEYNRMEANAQVTYNDQARRAENAQAARDTAAALVGLRNALAAADARATSGQAGGNPSARTGADDARTLRIVASECTAEYGKMAANAVSAGSTVTSWQDYTRALDSGL